MGECETRTQGAFVAGGYGRDRGRRLAPPSAAGRHVAHFETGSKNPFQGRRPRRAAAAAHFSADAAGAGKAVLRARRTEATGRVAVRRAVVGMLPGRARLAGLPAAARERGGRVRPSTRLRRRHKAEAEPYGRSRSDVTQEASARARTLEARGLHRITSPRPLDGMRMGLWCVRRITSPRPARWSANACARRG